MTTYIRFPIETNPEQLRQDVYNYIKVRAPQWLENDGNLDTWIIQAISTMAAEIRELASDVPDDIFRFFGATMMAIPPIDASQSTVNSTWTVRDNSGYTIRSGTQVGIRNTVGDIIPFEVVSDVVVAVGQTVTGAGAVLLRSIDPGAATAGLGTNGTAAELIDVLDYVTQILLTGTTTGGVDAEADDDYLNRLTRNLRLLSQRPILPVDFAILARNVAGVYRAVAVDGYSPLHNLLTVDEASFETSVAHYTGTNCAITSDAAFAADGTKSMKMVSSSTDMRSDLNFANAKSCLPGETMTAVAWLRAGTTGRASKVGLVWYTAGGAVISTTYGNTVADVSTGFTLLSATGAAPPTAAFVGIQVYVTISVNTEVHYVDKASIRRGSGTDWVAGGTPDSGNPRTVTVAAIDVNGSDVSGTIQTEIETLLTANREVNFQAYVMGARRTAIDVTFAAKAAAGYTAADVETRAEAAVTAFLNAAVWGNSSNDPQDWTDVTVVRFSEVAQIISNVEGLDYWTSLTMGYTGGSLAAADVTIAGPASLATAGTIAGTVT